MSQVVVEGLKWVKHPTADLWRADNLLGRYQVYAVINIVSWAFDAHDGLTRSSGDAASVDEAKAAAQKDYEARIRSTLADPIPEAPADEEVEGVAVDCVRELRKHLRDSPVANIWLDTIVAALRRSTETDKPGVREAVEALRPFAEAFAKADDPGVSDLYDEQPFSLHVPLGAWRRARSVWRRLSAPLPRSTTGGAK